MSISEQVKELRKNSKECCNYYSKIFSDAADTIETLFVQLTAANEELAVANMERAQNERMTLDEAIEHLNDILKDDRKWDCKKCKNEHVQLREWLLELKRYRHHSAEDMERLEDCGGWILCRDRLPEERINPITKDFYEYQVTFKYGDITDIRHYKFGNGHWWNSGENMDEYVIAWRPYLPPLEKISFAQSAENMEQSALCFDNGWIYCGDGKNLPVIGEIVMDYFMR